MNNLMNESMEKYDTNDCALAERILHRHSELVSQRAVWDTHWQDIANYVMPRKSESLSKTSAPSTSEAVRIHDATAIRANMVLGNGQLTWMTPLDATWFSYDPPANLKGVDSVEQYYRECSSRAALEMARSSFYSDIHELYLDRGGFGTAVIFADAGITTPLNFMKFDVGTFCIAENAEGYVDTLSREFELDVRQAAQMFGEENLPDKLKADLDNDKKRYIKHTFIHH
ncbi:MAG: portal protein, partial [Chthoniobacterales bacterium]